MFIKIKAKLSQLFLPLIQNNFFITNQNKFAKIPESQIILASLFLNIFSINTIWTPTQGWYIEWAKLLESQTIYKEFYVPFPPLFVLMNLLFLNVGLPPLIATRILDLLVFSILSLGIFKLASIYFSKTISFWATITSIIMFQVDSTNTIGGYYEFAMCCAVWGTYLFTFESNGRKFVSGLLLAFASLTKQNYIFLLLALFLYSASNLLHKRSEKSSKCAILGMFLPIALLATYLFSKDALVDFIRTMIEGGGKNPNLKNLVLSLIAPPTDPFSFHLFTKFALLAMAVFVTQKMKRFELVATSFLVVTTLYSVFPGAIIKYELPIVGNRTSIFVFALIVTFVYLNLKHLNKLQINITLCIFLGTFFSFLILETINRTHFKTKVLGQTLMLQLNKVSDVLLGGIRYTLLIMGIFGLFLLISKISIIGKRDDFQDQQIQRKFSTNQTRTKYILGGLIVSGVVNAFNGGFDYIANIPLFIWGVCFILSLARIYFKFILLKTLSVYLVLMATFSIQFNVYSWFGWNEKFSKHNYLILHEDDNRLPKEFRGMALTDYQFNLYSDIYKEIGKLEEDKLKENSFVALPMNPIFNTMSNFKKYRLFCPIQHFDICPDRALFKDYENFIHNPPSYVLYFDYGDEFVFANEEVWRNGETSVFRKIRELLLVSNKYSVVKAWRKDNIRENIYLLELNIN